MLSLQSWSYYATTRSHPLRERLPEVVGKFQIGHFRVSEMLDEVLHDGFLGMGYFYPCPAKPRFPPHGQIPDEMQTEFPSGRMEQGVEMEVSVLVSLLHAHPDGTFARGL